MVSRQSELPAPADPAPGLDGRGFTAAATDGPGDADAQTVFDYHEDDGMVWAEYAGGRVGNALVAAPEGWAWFVPVFVAKLVVGHAVREEPYRPEDTGAHADRTTRPGAERKA